MNIRKIFIFLILIYGSCSQSTSRWANIQALPRAHAHNDYSHQRPLFDALEHGFASIEADILLINDTLLVGHDLPQHGEVLPLLDTLYLAPLFKLIKENNGRLFKNLNRPLYLLIDIKTDADSTYQELLEELRPYQQWLAFSKNGQIHQGAVKILLSGNRPIERVLQDSLRLACLDGRPTDLKKGFSNFLMPIVSDAFRNYSSWNGKGVMPDSDKVKIEKLVTDVHAENKKLRLWGTPDTLTVWKTLDSLGVDILNTDDLDGLRHYFLTKKYLF